MNTATMNDTTMNSTTMNDAIMNDTIMNGANISMHDHDQARPSRPLPYLGRGGCPVSADRPRPDLHEVRVVPVLAR